MGKDLAFSALLDVYGRFLSQKQKSLTEHYYNEDLSLSEIAENEGITRQGVSDNIRRAENKMLSWEKECGFCESFLRLKELSDDAEKGEKKAIKEILEIIEKL
jgi:predicted DNA-binding protein YlxM (UPF0122 family)